VFEKFTEGAGRAISLAHEEAALAKSDFVGTEHLLLAILRDEEDKATQILRDLQVDSKRLQAEIERIITPQAAPEITFGQLPYSPRVKRAIEIAGEAAVQLKCDQLGTEHLLLGLLQEPEGIAGQALRNLGIGVADVRRRLADAIGQDPGRPIDLRPPPEDLSRWAGSYRALTDRPSVQEPLAQLLQDGRSIALVGPKRVGKTALILALSRAKAANLSYGSVDYRIFDEFIGRKVSDIRRPGTVCFISQAELLTASRSVNANLLEDRMTSGERLILEFREGGLDAFTARYNFIAKDLVTVEVKPPDAAECRQLLESARAKLKAVANLEIAEDVLREADRLARERWRLVPPPWPSIITLWTAESIHRETSARGDVEQLERDIAEPGRSPGEIEMLKRHLEGLRSIGGTGLSIESVRRAIGELSGQGEL
jgi:ATP-dependent Clp protease ATP-binding subunit ClpC